MEKPVVILGAGPAGLACAKRLVADKRPVLLIDDNTRAGGQYFRQLPESYGITAGASLIGERDRAAELFTVLENPLVTWMPQTTAWTSAKPMSISYSGPGHAGRIEAAAIVVATGAQDAPFPFPGWTMPGVISAGGALNLAKGHGMVPEGRVMVAGNGPLVLVAAATLAKAGAKVVRVLEAQSTSQVTRILAPVAFLAPKLMIKGLKYRWQIQKAGGKFSSGMMIVGAEGSQRLEAVRIAPVGTDGRPDQGKHTLVAADTLVIGYGLSPGIDFARLLGCQITHDPALGGWVPVRSAQFETSVSGVYAVGDGAGIGGVEVAILEGEMVAETILNSATTLPDLRRRYHRLDRFRRALAMSYRLETGLSAADGSTIICRCEELRLSDLTAMSDLAGGDLGRLKSMTRLGMGRCQGRNCLSSAAELLGIDAKDQTTNVPYPRVRCPIRPVRIDDLILDQDIGPAQEPDEAILK